jgi:hypothetical protein
MTNGAARTVAILEMASSRRAPNDAIQAASLLPGIRLSDTMVAPSNTPAATGSAKKASSLGLAGSPGKLT